MALYKDASGQLVIAATMPPGGSVVNAAATNNLSDLAPWFGALDRNTTDWHPSNFYNGAAETAPAGNDGYSNVPVTAYKRSATAPTDNPGTVTYDVTIASITTALANGWTATIPSGTNPVYALFAFVATQNTSASILAGDWHGLVKLIENGTAGESSFPSYVFIRSLTQPATPSGGSYASPLPTTAGWSDGIPFDNGQPVWMAKRTFTLSGGGLQDAAWATPAKIGTPSTSSKLQFSIDGTTGWHDTPSAGDEFMRSGTSTDNGATWTYAGVVRIKGEAGSAGTATRGPSHWYTYGTVWSDSVANTVISAAGYTPMAGDQVTISGGNFAHVKKYTGSAWVSLGQVITGDLVVENSITASKLNTNAIEVRDNFGNVLFSVNVPLDFSRVGGSTRPANNATIGADSTNLVMGTGGNLLANSDFKAGIANWVADGGIDPIWDLEGTPWQPFGGHSIGIYRPGFPSNATSVSIEITDKLIRSMRYEFSAYLASHRCSCWVAINFHDSSGNFISQASFSRDWALTNNGGSDLNNWTRAGAFFTVPPNMAGARLYFVQEFWGNDGFGTASTYAWATKFFLAQAHAGQTELSTWAPGGAGGRFSEVNAITPANSGVLIENLSVRTLHIVDGDVSLLRYSHESAGSSGEIQNFTVNVAPQLVIGSEINFPPDANRGNRLVMLLDWWPWSLAHNTPITDRAEWQVQVVRVEAGIDVVIDNFYFETFKCTGGQTDKVTTWTYFNLPTYEFTFLLRATCLTNLGPFGLHRSLHGFAFSLLEFKR